jgi:hypothetical protein
VTSRAGRAVAFAALADPALPTLAGFDATEELAGALSDGRLWSFQGGRLVVARTT